MIGTKFAHYEITGHLGTGGMGEVYQATDSKLGRSVAIKLLSEAFAQDAERVARFEREARVLASLNHPNIAAIYGVEESGSRKFLVMELVSGETLAERIARGPIPVVDALPLAAQIAEALEAAHEKGVMHRDLKPANIKVTQNGRVKVLDFGLAKAFPAEAAAVDLSTSPTMSAAATNAGVILGTAAYMSPEQAKGRAVNRRADIFAFGCVLYEMLSGKPAFEGEDVTDILSAVLRMEPDWTRLPVNVSPRVRELLQLCLEKNASNRRSDATDVRLDIEKALKEPVTIAGALAAAPSQTARWGWIAVSAVLTLAFVTLAVVHFTRKTTVTPEMRLEITTPLTAFAILEFALSPDGQYIAFAAPDDGANRNRLWLRRLSKTDAQPLPGTEGVEYPFWSADSLSIGFFADRKLKRIDIRGGAPQPLASAVSLGGAWNADGTILFAATSNGPLSRIEASGGSDAVAVANLDSPRQASHRFPKFLPDGRHFLFYATGTPEASGIYLGSLDGGEPKWLAAADTAAAYLTPDTIVFIRQTTLLAQHLDWKSGKLTGSPVMVADPVGSYPNTNFGGFSVSADGLLAYRPGSVGLRQLMWFDRNGKPKGVAGEPDFLINPELSPLDGQRVAVSRDYEKNNRDISVMDLSLGGPWTRFTSDPANDSAPLWSPDGTRLVFRSNRKGHFDLYLISSSGTGHEQPLLETLNAKIALDWSKDGRFLLYSETDPKTGSDLWALPMTGTNRSPIPIANTKFMELNGQFSPNGRWVAYETNESGPASIVVQPFPTPSGKWTVSTNGGTMPRWRADSGEIYFIAPDETLMTASIATSGSTVPVLKPAVPLFPTRLSDSSSKQEYAVSNDGRFLLNQVVSPSANAPITVILNWKPPEK